MSALRDGYNGYSATVEFNAEESVFHGRVNHIRDVITFQSDSVAGLEAAFVEAVDDYIDFCESRGESPNKPYSGRFVVRISPELHRAVAIASDRDDVSLNKWVESAIQRALGGVGVEAGSPHGTRYYSPTAFSHASDGQSASAPLRFEALGLPPIHSFERFAGNSDTFQRAATVPAN